MAWLGRLSADTSYITGITLPMILIGAGQGGALGPFTAAGVAGVAPEDAGAASGLVNAAHQLGGSLGLGILVMVSAAAGSTTLDAAHLLADRVATVLAAGTGMLALALVVVLALIVRPGCDAGTRTYAELRNRSSYAARSDELLIRGHLALGIGKPFGRSAAAGRSPCYVLRRSDGPSPTPSEGALR
jgi:hypothetical protein